MRQMCKALLPGMSVCVSVCWMFVCIERQHQMFSSIALSLVSWRQSLSSNLNAPEAVWLDCMASKPQRSWQLHSLSAEIIGTHYCIWIVTHTFWGVGVG